MESHPDLESLYQQAQEALSTGKEADASELLKQLLLIDDDYRDAAQLLAGLVARQRRRWYSRPLPWAALVVVALIVLVSLLRDPLHELFSLVTPTPPAVVAVTSTSTPSMPTVLPSPTAIPLRWSRLYHGAMFTRDTVRAIAVDPEDPDVIYVGLDHAAIYKSMDGGVSWTPAHAGLGAAHVLCLTIDPQDPHRLYASLSGAGVFRSIDGGSSWRAINVGLTPGAWWASSVALDPLDSTHVLYTNVSHLFESRDSGDTWIALWSQDSKEAPYTALDMAVYPGDPKTIFVAGDAGGDDTRGGVYISSDGGRTWSLAGVSGGLRRLAIDATGQYLYASNDHVVGSSDGGKTWRELAKDTPCVALAVLPDDGATVFCGMQDGGLLATMDAGSSWTRLGQTGWGAVGSIDFLPGIENSILVGARGVYLSTDGGLSWAERLDGLGAGSLDLILGSADSPLLYAMDSSQAGQWVDTNAFRSSDGGRTWTSIAHVGQGLALDADGQTIYRFHPSAGEVIRSDDGGVTWTRLLAPAWIGSLASDATQTGRLLLYSWNPPHVYQSMDRGASWQPSIGVEDMKGGWFFFASSDSNRVYVAGIERVYHSNDAGSTWGACEPFESELPQSTTSLAIDPRDAQHVFLSTRGKGILLSHDGCSTWRVSTVGMSSLFVNTLAIDPNSPDTIYAGTDGGAYVSFDGGEHWGEINEGLLGATVVYSIVVDTESNVYAATPYGIFKLESR